MIVRTIHHFEDEPELVKWIPGALLNSYWKQHPEWIVNEGNFAEQDDRLTSFELHVNTMAWKIEYRLYTDLDDFNARFHGVLADIALIDLMNAGEFPGLEVYEKAAAVLGTSAVYFLTAFPGVVKARGQFLDEFVLSKPVDVADLAALLIRKLGVQ